MYVSICRYYAHMHGHAAVLAFNIYTTHITSLMKADHHEPYWCCIAPSHHYVIRNNEERDQLKSLDSYRACSVTVRLHITKIVARSTYSGTY